MNSTLDSRQLLAFSALVRRGSFTVAAKDLFLTQSAVSHAIKALEIDVGCRLLDRVGRRVLLTQAGEKFLRHTEKILQEMESARLGIAATSESEGGRLRVGAGSTACQHILPKVLIEFQRSYPKCVIRLESGDHAEQLEWLRSGRIDVALVLAPAGQIPTEFAFTPIFDDELCFVVAPRHPWAALMGVPRESIHVETLLISDKSSQTFRLIEEYFREETIFLSNLMEVRSIEAVRELVKIGLGPGILAQWLVRDQIKSGSLIALPLGSRKIVRSWGVAYKKGRCLEVPEQAFRASCVRVAGGLGLSASEVAA